MHVKQKSVRSILLDDYLIDQIILRISFSYTKEIITDDSLEIDQLDENIIVILCERLFSLEKLLAKHVDIAFIVHKKVLTVSHYLLSNVRHESFLS